MCQPRGTKIIDECLKEELSKLNDTEGHWKGKFSSILSCCGHKKYEKTIVVRNNYSKTVFEWFSGQELPSKFKNGKIRTRYYKKDQDGVYFIPELLSPYSESHPESHT